MNCSVFIINGNGLYCSNDAELLTEKTLIKDDKGKPISSKHTIAVRAMNYYKVCGNLVKDEDVYCQYMLEESGLVQTYSATISGFTDEMMILNLKALNLHNEFVTQQIKNKIKEEINYGS